MNGACLAKNTNLHEQNQHASFIRHFNNNFVRMKRKLFLNLCLLTLFVFPVFGHGDKIGGHSKISDGSKENFGLFEDDKLIDITLRFDLTSYFRTKPKEEYLKANITFHLSETDSINSDIRLKTRGVFRNRYCHFAPIELNFKKADFGYTDLNKISKIKLVPECNSGGLNETYVLREYLIYKLFNVLTDTSFRVRLVRINYLDTQNKKKPITQFGFFIEPVEMLAARANYIQIKSRNLTQKNITPKVMDRLAIFNYMVGNYDWSIPGQHNVKVFRPLIFDTLMYGIAIPYDFDWTGLVNASYAVPAENVGTESVRERVFTGICRSKEVFLKDLDGFLVKKEEFYRVINEFPYLNQREKRDIIMYLDDFYRMLVGRMDIMNILLYNCKKI